jgi:hypothetical protein
LSRALHKRIQFTAQGMKASIIGEQAMCQLPNAELNANQADQDDTQLAIDTAHQEDCTHNQPHAENA